MAYGAGLTRGAQLLTHRTIETLRPAEAPYRVPDQRCKGLAVRVAPSGVKTWDLAYRIRGTAKMRRLSLGRTTDVSLEQARERANELTSAARAGRDLIGEEGEARDAAASRITVGSLIDLYLRRRVVGRLRTAKTIESRLRRTLTPILQRYAVEICRRDIRELLNAMVDQGKAREAEKRRQVCTAMFRWALSQDIVEADPTAGLEVYDRGTLRDRVLTVEEIETLWRWLDSGSLSPDSADVLKLERALGARCGEISGLRAEEIDRQKWIWTLPPARSKNKRQRVTPIVGVAREILERRLAGVQKGPLFVIENGAVITSAHVGHYLLTRGARLPIPNSHPTISDGLLRQCWRKWASRSIWSPPSWVMSRAAKTPARWCAITCAPTCSNTRPMRCGRGTSSCGGSYPARPDPRTPLKSDSTRRDGRCSHQCAVARLGPRRHHSRLVAARECDGTDQTGFRSWKHDSTS
jgi:integrase